MYCVLALLNGRNEKAKFNSPTYQGSEDLRSSHEGKGASQVAR